MLRPSLVSWLVLPAALLGGCPMYSDGCVTNEDCAPDYLCDYPSGACLAYPAPTPVLPGPERCNVPSDCNDGEVCDRYHRCVGSGQAGAGGTSSGSAGEAGAAQSGAGGA